MKLNQLLLFICFMAAGSLFVYAEDCTEGVFKYTADDGCGYKTEICCNKNWIEGTECKKEPEPEKKPERKWSLGVSTFGGYAKVNGKMTEDTFSQEACNNGRNIWVTFYNSYSPFDNPNVSGWKEVSSEQEVIDFSYTTDPAACPTLGAYYLGPC